MSGMPGTSSLAGFEPADHDADHGPLDPGLGGHQQPFVVAVEPPAAHQPHAGALHHPPARQHREPTLPVGLPDQLDDQATHLPGVGDQPTGLPTVGEHRHDRRHHEPQPLEDHPAAVTVLHAGGGHRDQHQQPECVSHDVSIPSVDLLPGVIAPRSRCYRVGAASDRLGLEELGRGGRGEPSGITQPVITQYLVERLDGAVVTPASEVLTPGLSRRQIVREEAPHTAGAQHDEDGVDDRSARMLLVTTGRVGYRQDRLDEIPLGSGQIGGVGRTARDTRRSHTSSSPTVRPKPRDPCSISPTTPSDTCSVCSEVTIP